MRLLFKNNIFKMAAFLAVFQQVFVGLSTFMIGSAGAALDQPNRVLWLLAAFFGSIAVAYVIGTSVQWLGVRLSNDLWSTYTKDLLLELSQDIGYASDANKKRTNTWLTGEAHSTLEYASTFSLDFLSISCNILFTMVAFLAILGPMITASIMLALVTSFSMLWVARRTITTAGGNIQKAKMQALLSVQSLWDHAFFGNRVTRQQPTAQTKANLAKFFRQTERFKLLEQGISCFPIFLSMGVLYAAINHQVHLGQVLLPALVAVLPRSLQLFQNVHTVNTYSSQYLLLSAKLKNLRNFPAQLERREMGANIDKGGIDIQDVCYGNQLDVDTLMAQLKHATSNKHGRFRITGRNGAGKSSLLRDLKALLPDAVLLGPDIRLLPIEVAGSTGQIQRQTLHAMLEQGVSTLLLDEWDANLDQVNATRLDGQIDELSKRALVIEVRHSRTLSG